jgi:hypothetical protein
MTTSYDHPDFKLNEQQEAVLWWMKNYGPFLLNTLWFTAYDLHGKIGKSNFRDVKIGDAGRRMRELRQEGILESRKRGRFEEYRLAPKTFELQIIDPIRLTPSQNQEYMRLLKGEKPEVPAEPKEKTVTSREEAYDLVDQGWTLIDRETKDGYFTATLQAPQKGFISF